MLLQESMLQSELNWIDAQHPYLVFFKPLVMLLYRVSDIFENSKIIYVSFFLVHV